jgi:hypothetical protein
MEVTTEPSVANKSIWLLTVSVSAAALLLLAVSLVLGAPQRIFFHRATNLSRAPSYQSGLVDISVSSDGDRLAAVWAEAYVSGEGKPPHGNIDLSWASESVGLIWTKRRVYTGSSSECAVRAAVAVTGTSPYTAHLAYVVQSPCSDPNYMEILYQPCPLTYGAPCGASRVMVSRTLSGPDEFGFRHVDITLDAESDPHLTYASYVGVTGTLYYRALSGGILQSEEQPPFSVGRACNSPSIAWSNGNVHLVWEDETVREIHYMRRPEIGSWEEQAPLDDYGTDTRPPRNPDIAARGSQVIAVWDMGHDCPAGSPLPACTEYSVAFLRSNDDGVNWFFNNWREVGTNRAGGQDNVYFSADGNGDSEDWPDSILFLQPSVALDGDALPTVVWHSNWEDNIYDPDYDIYYTRAVSQSGLEMYNWITPTVLSENTAGHQGGAVVAVANVISPFLHVAYAQQHHVTSDWEAYYDVPTFQAETGEYEKTFLPILLRTPPEDGD